MLFVSFYTEKTINSRIWIIIIVIQKICTEMKNTLRNFVIDTSYARSFNIKYFPFEIKITTETSFIVVDARERKIKDEKEKDQTTLNNHHMYEEYNNANIFSGEKFFFSYCFVEDHRPSHSGCKNQIDKGLL